MIPPLELHADEPQKEKKPLSRLRIGLLVAIIFFSAATLGGWYWSVMIWISMAFGIQEVKALMGGIGIKPSQMIIYITATLLVLAASLDKPHLLPPILTIAIIASFFRLLFRSPMAHISDIGGTLIAIFYMGYFPVFFILVRHLGHAPNLPDWRQPGLYYLLMILAVTSASDIAAYYVGKAWGKHPLYLAISPKKTLEGAFGGLVGGVIIGIILTILWSSFVSSDTALPLYHTVILSVILVIVGLLGDLTESMMKRDVGIKDSGVLLASHGGFLDRADSYIFSATVCYYYIYWIILNQGIAPEVFHFLEPMNTLLPHHSV